MNLEILIPSAAVFLTVVCASGAAFYAYKGREKRRLKGRLNHELLNQDEDADIRTIIFHDLETSQPGMMSAIRRTSWGRSLDLLTIQADSKMGAGGVAGLTFGLMLFGVAVGLYVFHNTLVAVGLAVSLGYIPTIWLKRKKTQRIEKFEKQFPDALDMLTGALRAGLAFPAAIQVVADESPQPMSKEFRIVFEENRLGIDMKEALRNLSFRVDSNELRLFVTASILQRETGGNLAEILEGTAEVIRDRFRILGDVKTMTSQARLSAMILSALPLGMIGVIMTLAPDYLKSLLDDPVGPYLIFSAVGLQVAGFLIMRRIVNIRV